MEFPYKEPEAQVGGQFGFHSEFKASFLKHHVRKGGFGQKVPVGGQTPIHPGYQTSKILLQTWKYRVSSNWSVWSIV